MASAAQSCQICQQSGAIGCCTCTIPPLPICSDCVLMHLPTPGTHVIRQLPPLTSQPPNGFCAMCHTAVPEAVCCCESEGVQLCPHCVFAHNTKTATKVHMLLPVKAKPYVSASGYLERLRARQLGLEAGLTEARNNIEVIAKCREHFTKHVQDAIDNIVKYREERLAELESVRQSIESAITSAEREMRDHIFEDNYSPISDIASQLWNYRSGALDLFSYSLEGEYQVKITRKVLESPPAAVAATPPRSVSPLSTSPQGSHSIMKIMPHSIAFFNPAKNSFDRQVSLKPIIASSQFSSAAILPNGKVFLCGRDGPISDVAFEIDPQTGATKPLPQMFTKRFGHAVLAYKACVYVFGGTGSAGLLRDCEKFVLSTQAWERIASMKSARDFFNPCTFRNFVMIFGGRGTALCEKYDIGNDCYQDLPLRMQATCQTMSVAVGDDSFLIIQGGKVYRWTQTTNEIVKCGNTDTTVWATISPVVIEQTVYIPQSHQARVLKVLF